MTTNIDTVDLVGDTSTGQADFDLGLGAPSGSAGQDAVGYTFSQPFPGILRVVGSDNSQQDFALPPGLPGKPGDNGITPTFIGGSITLQPFGSPPAIVVRSTSTPNTYAVDLYMPDPALSAVQANQAAGQAAGSAAAAGASAGQAASSASASQTSANASASSASASQGSATASQASADAAAAAYDSFDDRYLGPKAADPTLDNDGNALVVGALYYNTGTQPGMRVRTAAGTWDKGYAVITGGVTSFKGRDGAVVPQTGDYSATQIAGLATRSLWLSMIF